MCTGNFGLAKDILIRVFSNQRKTGGDWPQWFMFDGYDMCADECHGDVIFWPMKCIADYITASGDATILDETVPYSNGEAASIKNHLKRCAESIRERFLPGTFLISYAGGDWDDTLQPANPEMKEHMVSSWTQALAYQVFNNLSGVLHTTDSSLSDEFKEMARNINESYKKYLMTDGVTAGFAIRNADTDGGFEFFLHPRDVTTGMKYRLIPMTRSIISEMFSTDQALNHIKIIEDNFLCPDGVRLTDKPSKYNGGVSRLFKRAEQAANVGREIGLQYTHAHIRFLEALAKLGHGETVWDNLFVINPIGIDKTVPNALPRQSNLYFSSSDGDFLDRYKF
jgi:cellobiose phosphorylase